MFGGPEGVVVLILVLVLFGGAQLPKLARNLGRAQKEFREGLEEATKRDDGATPQVGPSKGGPSEAAVADGRTSAGADEVSNA